MIYKKPQDALHMLDLVVEGGGVMSWVREVRLFLSALPDQFEIVPEGHVCVKWPEGLTKETLIRLADKISQQLNAWESWPAQSAALYAPAAIAPVEKKKRKVNLYERHDKLLGWVRVWDHLEFHELQPGWRKVGECEVSE